MRTMRHARGTALTERSDHPERTDPGGVSPIGLSLVTLQTLFCGDDVVENCYG